jgi:hypothetical protein
VDSVARFLPWFANAIARECPPPTDEQTTMDRRAAVRRFTLTFVLLAMMFVMRSASATPQHLDGDHIMRAAVTTLLAPAEWDGVWTTLDSTYTCAGAFQSTSAGSDTICGGKDYTPGGSGSPFTIDCTGTADATTIDMTCTGSGDLFTDCTETFTMTVHGTRTGDTYHLVSTIDATFSGTACSFFPPSCTQVDSWGTRTGPAPIGYCSTPTRAASWGRLKTIYR